MKKIIDFLRSVGLLHASKGDFQTGNFDNRKDLKNEKQIKKSNKEKVADKKYLVIFVVIGIVMMFLFWNGTGLTFWFFLILILWALFLWSINKKITLGTLAVKKTIIIGIVLVILTFLFIGNGTNKKNVSEKVQGENSLEKSSIDLKSTYKESYSAQMSASNQFTDSETNTKVVSMWINTSIRMYTPDPYKKVSIKNITLENKLEGNVRLLIPAGGYSEKFSKGNEINYEITEESTMRPGTVQKNMAYMPIQIKATDAFKFDTNKAFKMSKAGIGPSRTFQYVGLDASDLDNVLEFDVAIEFESGEKKIVHFSGKIKGEEFLETGGVKNIEMTTSE